MKKSYLTIALTLTVLFGTGINAIAQESDRVVTKVPFEFMVGAKTLPAGTYTVSHAFSGGTSELLIRGYGEGAFVLPIDADSASAGEPKLTFKHVGGRYFLSTIETPERIYNLSASPEMIKLGQMKDNGNLSSAGGN